MVFPILFPQMPYLQPPPEEDSLCGEGNFSGPLLDPSLRGRGFKDNTLRNSEKVPCFTLVEAGTFTLDFYFA
jgi:hypothetical protein